MKTTYQTTIVGSNHYEGALTRRQSLEPGTAVTLHPEPTNQYDQNAIEVKHEGLKLGYIPRGDAPHVKMILEDGSFISAETTPAGGVNVLYESDEDDVDGSTDA